LTKENILVDASPMIVLIKSELVHILPLVFERVFVTPAVYNEVLDGPENDIARNQLPNISWLERISEAPLADTVAEYNLGSGESEVLSTALARPGWRVLIDDAAARKCAVDLRIPMLGTGGFLALASRRGHLGSLETALNSVRSSGLWISDSLVDAILANKRSN
jgi:predicted nucleic acid-binding protein